MQHCYGWIFKLKINNWIENLKGKLKNKIDNKIFKFSMSIRNVLEYKKYLKKLTCCIFHSFRVLLVQEIIISIYATFILVNNWFSLKI